MNGNNIEDVFAENENNLKNLKILSINENKLNDENFLSIVSQLTNLEILEANQN